MSEATIPIKELMEKTEQWLLGQGYKKSTLGFYRATWNRFLSYSASPAYSRETAEQFLLQYFGVDVHAIDQTLDGRMRHARRHMNALDEIFRTGTVCRRKVYGVASIDDDCFDKFFSDYLSYCKMQNFSRSWIPFLTEDDLSLLLSQPDASTRQGLRDLTLLALLYDSGARVQELVDLRLKDVRLTHPPMVILTGKGRKVRQVPLMKDTCKLLDRYIRSFHSDSQSQMIPLFYNAKKQALSRYGVTYILKKYAAKASPVLEPQNISPHVLRHTKAMHLLRAGVNMIYIRDFLGHADISTTEVYARIDAEMKRKVFEEKVPNYTPNTTMPWEEDEDLLQWLTQFGKKTF